MILVRVLSACARCGTMVVFATLSSTGRSAGQDVDPAELVKDFHALFGEHHARATHAKGVVLDATFEPTGEARQLSKASDLRRQSSSHSASFRYDRHTRDSRCRSQRQPSWPRDQVHAWRRLRDGSRHAQLQWLSRCYSRRIRQLPQSCCGKRARCGKAHADREVPADPPQCRALRHTAETTAESLATTTYFGVNAFAFVDTSGKKTTVRYRFVPRSG